MAGPPWGPWAAAVAQAAAGLGAGLGTVKGLEAGTLYEFSVYAVEDGFNSSVRLKASTGERQPLFVLFLFVLMGGDRRWWRVDRRMWHPPSPRVPLGHNEQAMKKEHMPYKKRPSFRPAVRNST